MSFWVDHRECLEKVKSVSTARFTPVEAWYNLFTGEMHGGVASIKTGRMCCLALVTIDRWQNSIPGTFRRIVMLCGKVVLPLLHTNVPLSSPKESYDRNDFGAARYWPNVGGGSSSRSPVVSHIFRRWWTPRYFSLVFLFTKETMSLNTISTYAAINFEHRTVSIYLHFLLSKSVGFHLLILKCIF